MSWLCGWLPVVAWGFGARRVAWSPRVWGAVCCSVCPVLGAWAQGWLLCRHEGSVEVRTWLGREQGGSDFLSGGFLRLRRKQKEVLHYGEVGLGESCSWCGAGVGFQEADLLSAEHF